MAPLHLGERLAPVASPLWEPAVLIGTQERVAARLVAARVPAEVVKRRRGAARKTAKKKGYTPSPGHWTLWAWQLCIPKVPATIWQPSTVRTVYPLRWQIERIVKSGKSYLHVATLNTTKEDPAFCYLYGRMLLLVLNSALCPQGRATIWAKKRREVSVLQLVRPCQAFAERWMQALLQSVVEIRCFFRQLCATAERLLLQAARQRGTTAQLLRESLQAQHEALVFLEAANA